MRKRLLFKDLQRSDPAYARLRRLPYPPTEKLRTARDLLLPRLMSGEIAV